MVKRWFFLWMIGVMIAGALAYSVSSGSARSVTPLPDPQGAKYKGHKDIWALWYTQDTVSQLQKEHQMILEALDDLNAKIEKLEKGIESWKNSS